MSAICHGFVQNAWRKDICSNCFRLRDEHSVKSDLNHRSTPQYNQSQQQQQHLEHSENNNNNNSKMNAQNHSISILVKNGDNNSYKNPSPRYQSPTSGIPRASSHLKYQHSLSGKSYFNGSTFSVDSIRAKAAAAAAANGLNKTNTNSSEVIDISGNKKSVTHPLRGDKSENHHLQIASNGNNNNRLTNNILNGSSAPPALNLVASSSSTVVSVNGKSERSGSTAHFNNNHSSTNANNSSQGSSSSSSNRRNNSVSSGPAGGASSCSGSTSSVGAPCANGTVVSVLTNGHSKTLQYPKAVGFASDVNSKKFSVGGVGACESSSGMKVAQKSAIMDTTDGDITNLNKSRTKGILKAVNGKNPKRLSVKFPKEVVEFIGYGDDLDASEEEEEEDDDDELSDPQDNAPISELLANNSTSPEEKELHQQTIKNTNFNSIKSNLMGFAPIEIGPIVGCTGGKSMENSSKPLVSIETFESRKEPLRITRKSDANGVVDVVPVDSSSKKQQATVPSKITSEKTAAIGALFKNSSTTTEVKTSGNKQQQPRSANNANDEYAVVNKKSSMKVGATNGRQQHDVKFKVTSGNDGVSTIEVNPEKFPITLTTEIPCKTSEELRNEGERSKPKSILKATTTTASTTTSFPNKNSNDDDSTMDSTLINSTARSSGEKSLSNLIILNSGSIASKRTSFLQEIISAEPVTVLTGQTTTENYSSEEPVSLSMERDSLEASMHHLKLGPFKSFEIEDNSSEFDDSLEDSGLDIGKTKAAENSESDDNDNEKFIGSNSSDSGNENDFTERGDTIPKGLYISVDDDEVVGKANDEDGLATQPKLSPDSVLFSSASETSNTGSAESIPECLNVQVIASVVKRQAPAPPPSLPAHQAESLYANENGVVDDEEQQVDQCDVYDDVSCYQKPIMTEKGSSAAAVPTFPPQQAEVEEEEQEDEEEESIYDDCNAISTNTTSNGKFMTGSYDFTNGTRTKLDTDSGPDLSDRIPRHVDGIEFIGIRKIDSETHLNNAGLSIGSSKNKQQRSPSPEDVKRERSSSVSPKARRKVNHFFSTIGKRAGAAFGSSHSPLSGAANFMRQKSPSPGPVAIAHEYKRSLSQDEVSMTRTQEIYATLTPASLKFKGLAPVLQKLSRMDTIDGKEDSPKEKMFKKHKLLPSIKKLLRMGSKDVSYSGTDDVRSYDFKTDLRANNSGGDSSPGASSESSTPNPPSSLEDDTRSRNTNPSPVSMSTPPPQPPSSVLPNQVPPPKPAPPSSRPPPPPPPRVHSLDLMHRVGQQVATHGPNGTIKPARPPPPVRSNRVAPSFVSMFAAPVSNEDEQQQHQQQPPREVPPNKPRRKASMNTHSTSLVMRSDGEPSLENHVSNLNIETLKLIAGQAPEKIRQNSSQLIRKSSGTPIRWSQFYITDVEPMASGDGFAFYCGRWDDEPCVLLLEEESNNSVVVHLSSCVEICTSFVDIVPAEYVPWNVADYSNGGLDVRASISVLPPCMVTKISSYISSRTYPSMQKYYALLQALSYWGKADMSDLFVLEGETQPSGQTAPAESELVYVCPIPSPRSFTARCSSQSTDFEILLKQYLLQPCVTSHGDQQVLLRIISGSPSEVEAQVKLFLQVKLFGDRMKPEELDKLRKTRTDRAILQWLERERALCMKEAIERTLFRESAPISPMRKSFVEFLMIPDTSAKALLELVLDLSK